MDLYMIVLRLIHIFSGVFWVGTAFFMGRFLFPTVSEMGEVGGQFMDRLVNGTRLDQAMPVASILTVLSGLLMYWPVSGGLNLAWITSGTGVALTVGALAGVAAFLDGLLRISPVVKRMETLSAQVKAAGGPPSPEQARELKALQNRAMKLNDHSIILLVVALLGMSTAQYF